MAKHGVSHNFYYKKVKPVFLATRVTIASTGCSCGWLGDIFWSRHYARVMHRQHAS